MAVILGGGLGGLSAGYYLLKNNLASNNKIKLYLIEASTNCGGWIKTIRSKDYLFEQGPRTIRPKGVVGLNTLNIIEDIGLSEHVSPIKPDHPAAKNRMIYVNNHLYLLPSSLKGVFKKMEPFSKPLAYALLNDLQRPHIELDDDSIYNFVQRRFGKEIADYAISPMICGICAGDAKEISVKFLMRTLFEWEQNHGGVVKGMLKSMLTTKNKNEMELSELANKAKEEKWNVYSIKGGTEIFPNTLHNYLKEHDVVMHLNKKIKEIEFQNSGKVMLKSDSGDVIEAKHVYSSIPAHSLANLIEKQHPLLSQNLRKIPYVTVGIVNLYFKSDNLVNPAFGFLVPPIENSPILGVVFDSCCIPEQNGTVLTVMMGGRWFRDRFGNDITHDELFQIAIKEVRNILNISEDPAAFNVNVLNNCIPQYIVGHYNRVDEIRSYIKSHNLPISVIGSSYDGVGINDVIYSAKTQVEEDIFA